MLPRGRTGFAALLPLASAKVVKNVLKSIFILLLICC